LSTDFSTLQNIPPEIERFLAGATREVEKTGKIGILRLEFKRDSSTGNTVIKEQYSRVPLFAQKAMYLEETLPCMAHVYIVSPSGGILQGDRYNIDINLGNNTIAHVTTQGATRIYKMDKNYASQIINIKVEKESYFEYIPDQIIPFRSSRFYQEVNLTVHDNATVIYSEVIVPGRVASGEAFDYDICYIKTIGRNQLGKLRFIDTVKLEPGKLKLRGEGILNNFDVIGTFYIVTNESYVSDLYYRICEKLKLLETKGKISGGISILPARQGIIVRLLGNSSENVMKIIYDLLGVARRNIINGSFSGTRKA
jgi:urease accessory protein